MSQIIKDPFLTEDLRDELQAKEMEAYLIDVQKIMDSMTTS